jgi:hypothetical protein
LVHDKTFEFRPEIFPRLLFVFWRLNAMALRGILVILLLFDVPILLTLVWALAEMTRQLKEHRAGRDNEGRGHQIA